jgi:hypothetical protein
MAFAQDLKMQYFRANDQNGVNIFETSKESLTEFTGVKVKLGGHFTQQYQGLSHSNTPWEGMDKDGNPINNFLSPINGGFNLATANLNVDVQLDDGIRLNLVTYLSSRHHTEAWVKGGYIQFDKLGFLNSDAIDKIMEKVTLKVGHMEINYGDAHFRRTDNGNAMYNPFIGNNIMDAFNTEIGGEIYYQSNGFLAMAAVSNGDIKSTITGSVVKDDNGDIVERLRTPAVYGKVGYDTEVSEDVRLRLTASVYHNDKTPKLRLYGGDRSGSRFYNVMEGSDFSGRFNPNLKNQVTSFMVNPFIKVYGLEVFGTYERAIGGTTAEVEAGTERVWNQYAVDVLYRFLENENLYIGGRYNLLDGQMNLDADNVQIQRYEVGAGWFLTSNILFKAVYVDQDYLQGFTESSVYNGGEFNGLMIEAVVGF